MILLYLMGGKKKEPIISETVEIVMGVRNEEDNLFNWAMCEKPVLSSQEFSTVNIQEGALPGWTSNPIGSHNIR